MHHVNLRGLTRAALLLALSLKTVGCAVAPDLTGYPANTPKYNPENKMFYVETLDDADRYKTPAIRLKHVYEVDPNLKKKDDTLRYVPIEPGDPLAVILQGVRIPEDAPNSSMDVAVVLDINTSPQSGLTTLVAFYQRDVHPGQMLNFANILVYAASNWDPSTAPYFRVRVLNVMAERNRRTAELLQQAAKINGAISGLTPHPLIPIVAKAIEAAGAILSNRENEMLMDYQVQLYTSAQAAAAGNATLGRMYEGQWLVLGRQMKLDATSWRRHIALDRRSDQLVEFLPPTPSYCSPNPPLADASLLANAPMPYLSTVLMKQDMQVPSLVMDRSQSFIQLLTSPAGKSDITAIGTAIANLTTSVSVYTAQRNIVKNHTNADIARIYDMLQQNKTDKTLEDAEVTALLNSVSVTTLPSRTFSNADDFITWWEATSNTTSNFEKQLDGQWKFKWTDPTTKP